MLSGTAVTLNDMLLCREKRAQKQLQYLYTFTRPVLSFCMNIPGPVKTTPDILKIFCEGTKLIFQALQRSQIPILDSTEYHEITGDELIICIDCNDAAHLKEIMISIEEEHPLGRLFDIDVIDVNGDKLSRHSFRECFICHRQAQDCASSRRHSVEEMQHVIAQQIEEYLEK